MTEFPFRLVAAPLAGISSRAYREILLAQGAQVAYGEMISARAVAYGNQKTLELLDIEGEASPRLVQISGSEPHFVAKAAALAVSLGAEYIDLNMGCPVPKVVRNHEGSALMQDPALAEQLIVAARSAGRPVSVKIRAGWDDSSINAVEFARFAEAAGAWLIAVHGRTRQQFYSGKADWSIIAQVKAAVSVPVLGNGDVFSPADALRMLEQTGCDGVMVGRGMLGNPWLFGEISAALSGRPLPSRPTPEQVLTMALRHLERHIQRRSYWLLRREGDSPANAALAEDLAVRSLRGHLGWYTKGLRGSARLREQISRLTTADQLRQAFAEYIATLADSAVTPLDKPGVIV